LIIMPFVSPTNGSYQIILHTCNMICLTLIYSNVCCGTNSVEPKRKFFEAAAA
jgi:hypothetical protein